VRVLVLHRMRPEGLAAVRREAVQTPPLILSACCQAITATKHQPSQGMLGQLRTLTYTPAGHIDGW
jgi:hypothetical protein